MVSVTRPMKNFVKTFFLDYSGQNTPPTTHTYVFHVTTPSSVSPSHSSVNQWDLSEHHAKPTTNPGRNSISETNRGESGVVSRPKNVNIDHVTEGPNLIQTNNNLDYIDIFKPEDNAFGFKASTTRSVEKLWPPPFPSTDPDADYVFEYEDGEPVTIEPDNVFYAEKQKKTNCGKEDFYCSSTMCITKTMICDGHKVSGDKE